jgi:urease accessory protein
VNYSLKTFLWRLQSDGLEGLVRSVPVSEVGRSGRLDLGFSSRRGRTVLARQYHDVPFKVTRAHYSSSSSPLARVIVMNSTPGLFGGDRFESTIHVEAGARALVTSQSATQIHPSEGLPAQQSLRIEVETGGELHYYVDPVIPFSDSRLRQSVRVDLGSGARFYYWDGLMAGRVRRGESWRFAGLSSETEVFVDNELAYLDRFELRPSEQPPTGRWLMNHHGYLATAIAYDPSFNSEFLETVRSNFPPIDGGFTYGLDLPFAQLMIGRCLAESGTSFRKARDSYERTILNYCEPV